MCKSVPAVFLFVRRKQVLGNTVECRHCVARTGIFCGFPLEWLTKCAESDIIEMLRSCVLGTCLLHMSGRNCADFGALRGTGEIWMKSQMPKAADA